MKTLIIKALTGATSLLFGLFLTTSCAVKDYPSELSLYGGICEFLYNGVKVQSIGANSLVLSKQGKGTGVLHAEGSASDIPECFPDGGIIWSVNVSSVSVKEESGVISFNDDASDVYFQSYEEGYKAVDETGPITVKAKVAGWIKSDSKSLKGNLPCDITISWTKDGKSHQIKFVEPGSNN